MKCPNCGLHAVYGEIGQRVCTACGAFEELKEHHEPEERTMTPITVNPWFAWFVITPVFAIGAWQIGTWLMAWLHG